ncbi:hypothetical protein D3C85_1129080 [compost metagenome]
MAASVQAELAAAFLKALHHRLIIDPLKDIELPCMAYQAVNPAISKTLNKPLGVGLFGIGKDHAVTSLDVDGEQHMFALNSDGVDQPLFGGLIRLIVFNDGRWWTFHPGDFLALVHATEEFAGRFGAVEDQHPWFSDKGWSVLRDDLVDPFKFVGLANNLGNVSQRIFAEN